VFQKLCGAEVEYQSIGFIVRDLDGVDGCDETALSVLEACSIGEIKFFEDVAIRCNCGIGCGFAVDHDGRL
jgi:ribosome biogenesis SPOUT family RNA methylase Rps3